MIENIIVLQLTMPIVIEIDAHLFPWVYSITPQDRRTPRRDPYAR